MQADNKYTRMQRQFYDLNAPKMVATNHLEHDDNPDYWDILLSDVERRGSKVSQKYDGCNALDFGCGCGRNVQNLYENFPNGRGAYWNRVDGVDISEHHIKACYDLMKSLKIPEEKYKFRVNNGIDLSSFSDDEYSFVMSTIVFQHIAVHEIRYNLMKEIYRVMKPGGLFSFQMGFGKNEKYTTVGYFENFYDATSTNSDCDVRVENPDDVVNDLKKIGFRSIAYKIRPSWSNAVHKEWIYVKAYK
jgi:ubiquinone/menaquinone biosynthesis C-methylase UbiE